MGKSIVVQALQKTEKQLQFRHFQPVCSLVAFHTSQMLQYNNIPLLRSAALTRVNVIARAIQTGPGSTDVLLWAVGRRTYLPHRPVVEHGAPNAAVVVLCVLR